MRHNSKRIAMLLGATATAVLLAANAAVAVDLNQQIDFNIAAGKLSDALVEFSKQAHVQVLASGEGTASASTGGVVGKRTVGSALTELLKSSQFEFAVMSESAIAVMDRSARQRRSAVAPSGLEARLAQPSSAQEPAEGGLEEIVVTGSYIRRSSFNEVGAPVDVLTRDDLLLDAPAGKASDFLQDMPQNRGNFHAGPIGGPTESESQFGGSSINLRGLGGAASLVLVNGKRATRFPIAEDGRVDVNSLVPTIAVDRVEVLNDGASGIYGTDAVAGVVNFITRDEFRGFNSRLDVRGATEDWNTASYVAGVLWGGALRDDTVHLTVAGEFARRTPLNRGEVPGLHDDFTFGGPSGSGFPGNFGVPNRNAAGQVVAGSRTFPDPDCAEQAQDPAFTQNRWGGSDVYFNPAANSGRGSCLMTFKPVEFVRGEKRWSVRPTIKWDVSDAVTFKSAFTASSVEATAWTGGSFPFAEAVFVPGENPGNTFRAVNANGQPLFALPDPANPTRPLRNAEGQVVLSDDPTDPGSGIAFNEDVRWFGRPASTSTNPPYNAHQDTDTLRLDADLSGPLHASWTWNLAGTFSEQKLVARFRDSIRQRVIDALNGRGGPSGDRWLNPFGSAIGAPAGSALANDPTVSDHLLVLAEDHLKTSIGALDAVASGEVLQLPAGPLSLAVGTQYRRETLNQDYDDLKNTNQLSFNGLGEVDFDVATRAWGMFVEAAVPLLDSAIGALDLTVAGRYEEPAAGLDSFDPKVSLSFHNERFAARASYGTSFLAPSLFQQFGNRVFREDVIDPLTATQTSARVRITGNRDLEPQQSTSFNLGVTFTPIERLSAALDYWSFDFEDLLSIPSAQGIVNTDPLDPRVERDADNRIVLVNAPFFNAAKIEAAGLDLDITYKTPRVGSVGQFSIGAQGTWMQTYDVQALASGPVVDGIGFANNTVGGTVMPEIVGQLRLGWLHDKQSAYLTGRYVSEVLRPAGAVLGVAESSVVVDAQYSFDFTSAGLSLTLGASNVFDYMPNKVRAAPAFFIFQVQNPVGREVYLGLNYEFR